MPRQKKEEALVKASTEVTIASDKIEVLPFGLRFKAELSEQEFITTFQSLQHANTVYQWYLGDLIAKMEGQLDDTEMMNILREGSGYDYETLKHMAVISRAYTEDVREYVYGELRIGNDRAVIGYTHFKIVAPLMGNDKTAQRGVEFLVKAGKQGWSTRTLIEQISLWRNKGKLADPYVKQLPESEEEIPDGWEAVKKGRYVPAPDPYGKEREESAPVEFFQSELEGLIELLNGRPKFEMIVERLRTALRGIS